MARTSIQDILLEEVRAIRRENAEKGEILARLETTMEEVKMQTLKTNGRVNTLEDVQSQQRGSIRAIGWVVGIVLTVIPIILTAHQLFFIKQ